MVNVILVLCELFFALLGVFALDCALYTFDTRKRMREGLGPTVAFIVIAGVLFWVSFFMHSVAHHA